MSVPENAAATRRLDLRMSNDRAKSMKRSRHTEEQIIAILKERDAGMNTAELCRKYGISEATFYNWKSKFAGSDGSGTQRLKDLEEENTKLKHLLADAILDNAVLKDLLTKKIKSPAR
jgi:putative transposase